MEGSPFYEMLSQLWGALRFFRLPDVLDIFLVTFLLYQLIKLLRNTRAIQLIKGILVIAGVYGITLALKMNASGYFFGRLWDSAIIVLFLIFQPEIRNAIETMGRTGSSGILRLFNSRGANERLQKNARRVAIAAAKAAVNMAGKNIGALIVFERQTALGDVAKTGTILDARVSTQLLRNIFFPNAPLHDGAVIIRGENIHAAGCVLPLTENQELPGIYGMRHRAALGISEQSDSIVLIVSEESGNISLAKDGVLQTELTEALLREELIAALDWDSNENPEGFSYAAKRWREFWAKQE